MQNVPKIVRERLKATTSGLSANHPDADALTAFAEHSLPGRDRDVVLEHLSRCGDCREIVVLALPAVEVVETAVRHTARGWLTWPALRWGLAAAGVVAITSLGVVRYQQGANSRNMVAKAPVPVEVASNQSKEKSLETSLPAAPATQSDKFRARHAGAAGADMALFDSKKSMLRAPGKTLSEPQVAYPTPSPTTAEQLPHGPRVANQWQQNMAQSQAPAAPPAPASKQQRTNDRSAQMQTAPSPEMVEVESAAAQADSQNKKLEAGKVQDLPPVRQAPKEEYALARVGKAKPAVTPEYAGAGSIGGPLTSATAGATPTSVPVPSWSISSNGTLQRSYDQGATWQVADVNANVGALDAASVQSTAKSSRADSKDAQAPKRDFASPTFRAVAANAADVWAGGSHGALYHSLDAGDHWTRILPSSADAALTGDIVGLDFVDAQHGRVSTSTAEIWVTSDGGLTWQKQ
jgi:hypothetical protein